MATAHREIPGELDFPHASEFTIGIAAATWNSSITDGLLEGAVSALLHYGVIKNSIVIKRPPGAFELPLTSQWLIEHGKVHGVIALGSVIQGETKHFDYVCEGTTHGLMRVALDAGVPVMFGVLTDNNIDQAIARSGGKMGNKGKEAAIALLEMLHLHKTI